MISYLSLGDGPTEVINNATMDLDGHDVGLKSLLEAQIDFIRLFFGQEPQGAYLDTKAIPTPYGKDWQIICWYEVSNQTAFEYAFQLKLKLPTFWGNE